MPFRSLFDKLRRLRESFGLGKHSPPPLERRSRLALTPLEDRTVPTTVTVAALVSSLGEADGNTMAFEVTRDNTSGSLSVNFNFTAGTATGGGPDFTATSTIFFGLGQSTAYVFVDPSNDSTSEPTETVICTLTSGTGYTPGSPSSATVNLLDNDAQYVSVAMVNDAVEDGTDGKFRFTRIGDLSGSLTANFSVGGTATSGTDFTSIGTSVTFAANSATADVTVEALQDSLVEGDETVSVTVTSGTGYTVGSPSSASLTVDDDTPVIGTGAGLYGQYFSNSNLTGLAATRIDPTVDFDWNYNEPASGVGSETFSARWTGQVQAQYSGTHTFYTYSDDGVKLWVNNQLLINQWNDHTPTEHSGTISLTAGQYYDIKVEYYDNTANAVMTLSWSNSHQTKVVIPATQLYDDTVRVETVSHAAEPGTNGAFRFTRVGDASGSLTVTYTVDGTATAGTDYTALSGSVNFAAGQSWVEVPLAALSDNGIEGGETVVVTVADGGTSYNLDPSGASGTITIFDDPPLISMTTSNVVEGQTATVTFARTGGDLSQTLTVAYTVGGSATAGTDYAQLSGSVTFAQNASTATVPITTFSDAVYDPNEPVTLTINPTSTYLLFGAADSETAVVVIKDAAPPADGGGIVNLTADTLLDGVFDDADDALEEDDLGKVVFVNADDDDGDAQVDRDQVGAVAGEDDLAEVRISLAVVDGGAKAWREEGGSAE